MQDDLPQIAASDYPATFVGADRASAAAQATHLRLQAAYLTTLVLTAVVSLSTAFTSPRVDLWLYGSSAALLVTSLGCLWLQRAQRYDKVWFDCRAVAESVKTITWRFMMSVPPFESFADRKQADEAFVQHLNEILHSHSGLARHVTSRVPSGATEITDCMHRIRNLTLNQRIDTYRSQRLDDQESWYCRTMKAHVRSSERFFWTVVILQALALFAAVVHLVAANVTFWSVPLLTTIAAVLTAWSQTRRFDELSFAYSVAAQELRSLRSVAVGISTSDDFKQLVEQVEEAVSREHTMWCARREIKLPGTDSVAKKR